MGEEPRARALVEQLKQAGGWPEPGLLEAVLAEGEAAVAPLLDIVQAEIAGEAGDAIYHAAPLLGTIGAPEALTPLITLLQRAGREDDFDVVETLLDALPLFGPPGVGPLLDLVRDPDQAYYARSVAMDIAEAATGNDPESRAHVADVLRALLADYVAAAASSIPDATPPDTTDMASALVSSLAALADAPARPLIDAAFAAGLVDPMMIRPEHVETFYAEGGTPGHRAPGWNSTSVITPRTRRRRRRRSSGAWPGKRERSSTNCPSSGRSPFPCRPAPAATTPAGAAAAKNTKSATCPPIRAYRTDNRNRTSMTTPKPLSLVHLVRAPAISGDGPAPLLVLLHGVGSNERDLLDLSYYLDGRFFVISVRAPNALGTDAFGWYPVTWTAQGPVGDTAKAEASRQAILRFLEEVVAAYNLDAARVFLMGFSQGAIMSLSVALTQPQAVAGIVPMSGRLLPEALAQKAPDDALRGLPVFAVHGTRDTVLPIGEGRTIRDELSRLPVVLTYREYDMAHEVSAESIADIAAWLTERLDGAGARLDG